MCTHFLELYAKNGSFLKMGNLTAVYLTGKSVPCCPKIHSKIFLTKAHKDTLMTSGVIFGNFLNHVGSKVQSNLIMLSKKCPRSFGVQKQSNFYALFTFFQDCYAYLSGLSIWKVVLINASFICSDTYVKTSVNISYSTNVCLKHIM